MIESDFFQKEQTQTLEDLFFIKKDRELIAQLHKMERMKESKKSLATVSGITNDKVLEKLVELEIRPEVIASLAMIPLIEVAWADGEIDKNERRVILDAACEIFITKESPDYALLKSWLKYKPNVKLFNAWKHYIQGLCEQLTKQQKNALKKDLIGHAKDVAQAAGGFLGFGDKISKAEQKMLDKLTQAFE
ncbi:MAG: TerB family tellurite resistance protein [Planctomycetaceae bacterium]|nr:TerB family tellurite resistance protein [Planctomycetaceae bacterium]